MWTGSTTAKKHAKALTEYILAKASVDKLTQTLNPQDITRWTNDAEKAKETKCKKGVDVLSLYTVQAERADSMSRA